MSRPTQFELASAATRAHTGSGIGHQDGKLGTQGFDRSRVPITGLRDAQPRIRIASLESKVGTQQAKIEQQQKQMEDLTVQLKKQAATMVKLTTQMKGSSPSAKVVVYKP